MVVDYNPNQIVPIGTQVVINVEIKRQNGELDFPRGTVGVIVKSSPDNTHTYRIRFMDDSEAALHRRQFTIRKHFQNPLETSPETFNLYDYVIYRCVIGSRAFGLDEEDSDTDVRGIYLPPADLHWSLFGVPEQIEHDATQEAYWELQKFIVLALKANPNILECLYTPLVENCTLLAQELLDMRSIFVTKMVYQTYNGYVISQFKKMQQDIRNHGSIRWKHAMHLIRLLLSGIIALREGYIPVHVEEHRERLLAIRREEMAWEAVNEWRLKLHQSFDEAFLTSTLPERPDYERANAFLIRARRSVL
jgi:predicted nucleotidyltransferase